MSPWLNLIGIILVFAMLYSSMHMAYQRGRASAFAEAARKNWERSSK